MRLRGRTGYELGYERARRNESDMKCVRVLLLCVCKEPKNKQGKGTERETERGGRERRDTKAQRKYERGGEGKERKGRKVKGLRERQVQRGEYNNTTTSQSWLRLAG